MIAEAIVIRPYQPQTDEAFVFSTWLRNYKYSSYFAKRIRPSVFFAGHHAIISHILRKPTTQTFIAHPKDDLDTILGYLVCEPKVPAVHFTFVKDAFRNMGIARTLIKASRMPIAKLMFTHWTFPVDELIKKYPDLIYDPYKM